MSSYQPGISVIVPSYAASVTDEVANGFILALASLAQQSLRADLFEVVLVFNGPRALDIAPDIAERFPELNLRVLRTVSSGAGLARNLGIASATRRFITFLDDDDALQPRFLEVALEHTGNGICVLLPIFDAIDGSSLEGNALNVRISTLRGQKVPIAMAPWALGFNACKIIPTEVAQRYRYDESLRSGEDVAFFAQLLEEPGMHLKVPLSLKKAAYLRTIRQNSVSRQSESFDFNVVQRLECIKRLRSIKESDTSFGALEKLENAQFSFVECYLRSHPDKVQLAINIAVEKGVPGLKWGSLRVEKARRLVFSYCFPPYADTAANVTAKVIREEGKLVDVFFADMGRVRSRDYSTNLIVEPFLVHSEELDVAASFSNWGDICAYASRAVRKAHKRAKAQGGYESIYSRALWSGSHVAAALFKDKNPNTKWEAEFSDPLSIGIDGLARPGKLTPGVTTHKLKTMIARSDWPGIPCTTHFELTELVTLLFADEVIFTNTNQQKVMLERYPADLQEFVRAKARIRHHAVPAKEMYNLVESRYKLTSDRVNIGYFGNFYANRGIGDVVSALDAHPSRDQFLFHIFTSRPEELRRELWGHPAEECIRINGYLPYLEFLNVAQCFDVLVVNDTDISDSKLSVNPFLPSKYADYVGSGAAIWGIVVKGSPLSKLPLTFESSAGELEKVRGVLDELSRRTRYNAP